MEAARLHFPLVLSLSKDERSLVVRRAHHERKGAK